MRDPVTLRCKCGATKPITNGGDFYVLVMQAGWAKEYNGKIQCPFCWRREEENNQ